MAHTGHAALCVVFNNAYLLIGSYTYKMQRARFYCKRRYHLAGGPNRQVPCIYVEPRCITNDTNIMIYAIITPLSVWRIAFKLTPAQIRHVEYLPLASVATRKFEDTGTTKKVLARLGDTIHMEDAFRMSAEAQFAMGWWFYTIDVSTTALQSMLSQKMISGNDTAAADQIISRIQAGLDAAGCDAQVRRASKPSIFARYWSWLMK